MQENNINQNINNLVMSEGSDIDQINKRNKVIKIATVSVLSIFIIILFVWFFVFNNKTPINNTVSNPSFPNLNTGEDRGQSSYSTDKSTSTDDNNYEEDDYNELVHIWPRTVSGFSFIEDKTSSTSENYVLFQDKETGNIYKSQGFEYKNTRLTNTTFPNSQKSVFTNTGDYIAIAYYDAKDEGVNPVKKLLVSEVPRIENGPLNLNGNIDENIIDVVSFSNFDKNLKLKNSDLIAYLKKSKDNFSELYIYNINTNIKSKIAELPITSISISWDGINEIVIKTNPSNEINQTVFSVNIITKKISVINTKNNTNTINPLNKNVLSFDNQTVSLYEKAYSQNKIDLELKTNTDKCVFYLTTHVLCGIVGDDFSGEVNVVDDWYKGLVQWNDKISIYNIKANENPEYPLSIIAGESIDFYKPVNYYYTNKTTSSESANLLFQNKRDLSLWLLDLDYVLN
jgi:hypothetical protein